MAWIGWDLRFWIFQYWHFQGVRTKRGFESGTIRSVKERTMNDAQKRIYFFIHQSQEFYYICIAEASAANFLSRYLDKVWVKSWMSVVKVKVLVQTRPTKQVNAAYPVLRQNREITISPVSWQKQIYSSHCSLDCPESRSVNVDFLLDFFYNIFHKFFILWWMVWSMDGAKRWVKESWLGFSTTQLSTDNFLLPVHPTTCQPTKIRDDQQRNMG